MLLLFLDELKSREDEPDEPDEPDVPNEHEQCNNESEIMPDNDEFPGRLWNLYFNGLIATFIICNFKIIFKIFSDDITLNQEENEKIVNMKKKMKIKWEIRKVKHFFMNHKDFY